MWARLVVAPWWVRWFASASRLALGFIPLALLLVPDLVFHLVPGLMAVLGFTFFFAAPITLVQRPTQRGFAAAVAGLSGRQRTQVARALRRGEIPSDPDVLAAAIRVGTLTMAYRRRAPSWQKTSKWWLPAMYMGIGLLEFLLNDTRRGVVWVVLTLALAAQSVWVSYRGRHLLKHLQRLRSAASSTPEASSVLAEDEATVALPPRRLRAALLVAVVGGLGGGALVFVVNRPRPECRIADSVVNFIADHRDMLDARLITPGDPGLDKYQNWSDQLQNYSRQVTAPDITPHLRHIAELSTQAVSLVEKARPDPPVTLSSNEIRSLETTYQTTVNQLVDEDTALLEGCHPHH